MGLGLGAEIVVGYSTLTEFVPPRSRGRWLAFMAFLVVSGLPVTTILGNLIIPNFGWRPMFVIAGVGSLIVWYLRKAPAGIAALAREPMGATAEAEALMHAIEKEAAAPGACRRRRRQCHAAFSLARCSSRRSAAAHGRRQLVLITVNTLIFGFVTWLPQFFVQQGLTITRSFAYHAGDRARLADRLRHRRVLRRLLWAAGRRIIGASVLSILFGADLRTFGRPTRR